MIKIIVFVVIFIALLIFFLKTIFSIFDLISIDDDQTSFISGLLYTILYSFITFVLTLALNYADKML